MLHNLISRFRKNDPKSRSTLCNDGQMGCASQAFLIAPKIMCKWSGVHKQQGNKYPSRNTSRERSPRRNFCNVSVTISGSMLACSAMCCSTPWSETMPRTDFRSFSHKGPSPAKSFNEKTSVEVLCQAEVRPRASTAKGNIRRDTHSFKLRFTWSVSDDELGHDTNSSTTQKNWKPFCGEASSCKHTCCSVSSRRER